MKAQAYKLPLSIILVPTTQAEPLMTLIAHDQASTITIVGVVYIVLDLVVIELGNQRFWQITCRPEEY